MNYRLQPRREVPYARGSSLCFGVSERLCLQYTAPKRDLRPKTKHICSHISQIHASHKARVTRSRKNAGLFYRVIPGCRGRESSSKYKYVKKRNTNQKYVPTCHCDFVRLAHLVADQNGKNMNYRLQPRREVPYVRGSCPCFGVSERLCCQYTAPARDLGPKTKLASRDAGRGSVLAKKKTRTRRGS